MKPVNDGNKLQLDEKNKKTEKVEKSLKIIKMYYITIHIPIRNKVAVSGKTIHSILNYELMGPVSKLRLPKA